jgi:hypothetical protein
VLKAAGDRPRFGAVASCRLDGERQAGRKDLATGGLMLPELSDRAASDAWIAEARALGGAWLRSMAIENPR